MKPTLVEFVSSFSGIGVDELIAAASAAPTSYKMYRKPKKRGGERVIFHPARRTKTIQYLLMRTAISYLPIHDRAMAYRKGNSSPLLTNAKIHAANSYLLKTDFREFFPSIKPADILRILHAAKSKLPFRLEAVDDEFLTSALFVRYPDREIGLAIGAPSSPMVSNVVMFDLDVKFEQVAVRSGAVYSRYADDMIFSTAEKGLCAKILAEIQRMVIAQSSPKLILNDKKTHLLSRKSRRPITGLIVGCDGNVSVGRKNKRKIRTLLFRLKTGVASGKEKKFLRGYLSFIRDVDPAFMDSLMVRFGFEVINLAEAK